MNKAKAFFYCCGGVFLLALAFHLGAMTATAQAPGNPVVSIAPLSNGVWMAATANGDIYVTGDYQAGWQRQPNIFGGPTPATQPTWGQIKSRYRPGAATQGK